MNNKTLITTIVSLIIGLGLGYAFWGNQTPIQQAPVMSSSNTMGHRMPDGSMMGGTPQMDMGSMMQGMMAGLNGKTGDAFDKEFLSEMIVHHQGAIAMAQAVLKTSKRPELLKLANDIISAQTKEIGMMQEWQKEWFK